MLFAIDPAMEDFPRGGTAYYRIDEDMRTFLADCMQHGIIAIEYTKGENKIGFILAEGNVKIDLSEIAARSVT